ncbi:hypothetical protein V8B97DRAFT_2013514 [Scleroderma yunnanense]
MISGQEVEMFCGVIGNQNKAYKLAHMSAIKAPMDFAIPLEAGDACITDDHISSVKNTNARKAVQVKGCVFHDGPTIIRVTSSFLYHSCFTNFKNTFETVDEPDYAVKLLDDAAVGAVQLKEWLAWEAESQPVKAGVTLVFHICSQVTFKDKTSYHNLAVPRATSGVKGGP